MSEDVKAKYEVVATFPRGIFLTKAREFDMQYVIDNYREGDRHEAEVSGEERPHVWSFEQCWIARAANGDILGHLGFVPQANESFLSRVRVFCFMSCENANKHKLAFVAASKPILRWMTAQCPPWVTEIITCPLESYTASIRWHERVLGFYRVGRVQYGDEAFLYFHLSRKEIEHV